MRPAEIFNRYTYHFDKKLRILGQMSVGRILRISQKWRGLLVEEVFELVNGKNRRAA
jgi:hypothetical protein